MRTKGASLAMATNWIMNYMVVQVTPPGIANLGWRFWIIWACICFSFIPITYLFYPETANRTLEDIDRFFESRPGVIVAWNTTAIQLHRPEEYIRMDEVIGRGGGHGSEDGFQNGSLDGEKDPEKATAHVQESG
ncbi:hypothetical protein VTN00DRAFT_2263 [Thermoascus crustaceus]|uniref:uncharacterized protein n=1 Tax=Thermoascus crustaceus TaxID=5088 RepID=UPI003743BEEE